MNRYWVIAPYDSQRSDIWDKAWQYDTANNVIAIGWAELKDISKLGQGELKALIDSVDKDKNQGWRTWTLNSMWNFWHSISLGDIVIARRGTKRIADVGEVISTAYYDETKGYERVGRLTDDFYSNFIGVKWSGKYADRQFERPVFPMQTIYEIDERKFTEFVEGKWPPEDIEILEDGVVEKPEFYMEKYLEEFIITNFEKIFRNKLILYRDEEGNIAQQYPTDVGIIDILAQSIDKKTYFVIELKKGKESDKVVGQILRYMGWVYANLKQEGQSVKGIIICNEDDLKMQYAVKMTENIEIKKYVMDFKLE